MTIICSVSARLIAYKAANANFADKDADVVVMIKKLSDKDNLFQFRSNRGEPVILGATDLDDVDIEGNSNFIEANFGDYGGCNQQIFSIEDSIERNIFKEAVLECRMLSEMTLRLESFVRDVYFAGIHSVQDAEGCGSLLNDMIQSLRDQQRIPTEFSIFNMTDEKNSDNDATGCKTTVNARPSVIEKTKPHNIAEMNCVFCGVQKTMEIGKDFAIHPYVPATFENKNIYMCLPCLRNWKEFREKAIFDKQLILKDEVNEELCGICSDTPAELIMCSECPRSFCNGCLMRILNEKEVKELDSFTDWICMCCHLHISSDSPELDISKWSIVKPALGKRVNSGMSLFSKTNAARLKKIMEVDDDGNNNNATTSNKYREHENMNHDNQKSDAVIQKAAIIQKAGLAATTSPDKVSGKSSSTSSTKKVKEICDQKEADKKESESLPVIADPSSPEDLPYLDDFDDGSSSEEEKEKEEEKVWEKDDDNDDDCNLIMSLPQQRFPNSGNFCKDIEMADSDIASPRKRRPPNKKVKQAPLSTPVKILNSKSVKKNAKRKPSIDLNSSPADILPPVNTAVDEVYYFSQYVQYYDGMCQEAGRTVEKKASLTDDVCFLCKDGGDLIECDDLKSKHFDSRRRCRKVYHSYCLAYVVEDDGRDWRCPRHFCDFCGVANLKYVCKFCPMSICKSCPSAMVKKYGLARYKIVETPSTGEFAGKVTTIVCQNCLDMYQRCLTRGPEINDFSDYTRQIMSSGTELRFADLPGELSEGKNGESFDNTQEVKTISPHSRSSKKDKVADSSKTSCVDNLAPLNFAEINCRCPSVPSSKARRCDKILNLPHTGLCTDALISEQPETKIKSRKRRSQGEVDASLPIVKTVPSEEAHTKSKPTEDDKDVLDVPKKIRRRPRNRNSDSASVTSQSDQMKNYVGYVELQSVAELPGDDCSAVFKNTVDPIPFDCTGSYDPTDTGNNAVTTDVTAEADSD